MALGGSVKPRTLAPPRATLPAQSRRSPGAGAVPPQAGAARVPRSTPICARVRSMPLAEPLPGPRGRLRGPLRGDLRADAIVVLGCRITAAGRPGAPAARRAAAGASAFFAGVAPRIVVSGGRRWGAQSEARALGTALRQAGVPATAVIEEHWSLSTHENAVCSAAILARIGARRAAVVTCPWHMARALQSFRAAGVDALPLPTGLAEMSWLRHLYLELHEVVCTSFDARAMRRTEVLAAGAARQVRGMRVPPLPGEEKVEVDA